MLAQTWQIYKGILLAIFTDHDILTSNAILISYGL